ncbi:transcriptional regulator [Methanoplanus sp. FWC-SCC4]|uniref:Transcriptional regulator n=1 Tax=Methanochimaera problematica TaxID=2609417 RepID=A0AA97FEC5_9EURY|nr:transcriptional regulator [Methanoplanus sp. FWC-SCC4]WOF16713.1 transcriptional regulator [Methanoplanus sp. FWC-SCC4]
MKSALRNRLAEKMAGEITLSEAPGDALKKWRMNFAIAPGILAEKLGVSPSVISDYEGGRRKSPGTAVVGKIVETILKIDEENGGKYMKKYAKILYSDFDDDVIYDMHDYDSSIPLKDLCDAINCSLIDGTLAHRIYGYTVVNSLNAIVQLSAAEFNKIYGWSTERALIFTNVSTGKSPMIAIRVTPFKPRCVILQGITKEKIHPLVIELAKRDNITLLTTEMEVTKIVEILREEPW